MKHTGEVAVSRTPPSQLGFQKGMLGRAAAFLLLFAVLQWLYSAPSDRWLERLVIEGATVRPAAFLIDTFDPSLGVRAIGAQLRAPGGGINILNGCEGTEAAFLLLAALLTAPVSWRQRLIGCLLGTVLVAALNQVRVVVLFYAFRNDKVLYDTLHGVVAPIMLIAAVGVFYVWWLNRHSADPSPLSLAHR